MDSNTLKNDADEVIYFAGVEAAKVYLREQWYVTKTNGRYGLPKECRYLLSLRRSTLLE